MTQHSITPPPELFAEWLAEAKRLHPGESTGFIAGEVARLAYQAGADQELETCCEYLMRCAQWEPEDIAELRAARRPKPLSLKEQAMRVFLEAGYTLGGRMELEPEDIDIIHRALEQLND
jgi:hypothetical protein